MTFDVPISPNSVAVRTQHTQTAADRNKAQQAARKKALEAEKKKKRAAAAAAKAGAATAAATEPAAEGAATWSKEEQALLEKGLKEFPSALKDERWQKISTKVSSRSPEECKKRYKQIVAMLKAKKAAAAGK